MAPWNCGSVKAEASAQILSEKREEGAVDGFEAAIEAAMDAALEGGGERGGVPAVLPRRLGGGRVVLCPSLWIAQCSSDEVMGR